MYAVSYQCYWPNGRKVIEIAVGGLHYMNADCLQLFGEFNDPRQAVECAIKHAKRLNVKVAYGATEGLDTPFDSASFKEARRWAEARYNDAPKCAHCGDAMPSNKREWFILCAPYDFDDTFYCSNNCADLACEMLERTDSLDD